MFYDHSFSPLHEEKNVGGQENVSDRLGAITDHSLFGTDRKGVWGVHVVRF